MRLRRLILCCALLCAAGMGRGADTERDAEPRAGAEPAAPPAPSCGTLRVAYYEDGALYYHTPDGNWTGIDKDVVDEMARRLGCKIEASTDSRVRIWAALANGTLDLSVSALITPERERLYRFVPYLAGRNYVILQQDLATRLHSMSDFLADPRYKIGVVKSFKHGKVYDAWLEQLRAQGRVFESADYGAMLRLFKLGRVQAVMASDTGWSPLSRQQQLKGSYRVMDWGPRETMVSGLVLSRQSIDAATAEQFTRTIKAMRSDGTLKRIYERHVDPEMAAGLVNF